MPLSFEATQTRSTFIDLLQAPTFKEINYADKNLWSAMYGDEIEALKESIHQGREPKKIKAMLKELQGMVGRLTLSPVVYGLGLLDLQKFLRTEIEKPEAYLNAIKEIRQQWRETLRKNTAFALENFATDALMAVRHVAKDEWDVQTAREVLAYYYGVIANPCYEKTVTLAKNFFSEFFSENYDENGVRIFNVLTKKDYREVLEKLYTIFTEALMQLPRKAVAQRSAEVVKVNDTTSNYLYRAWSVTKAVGKYVINHPTQAVVMGLAVQTAAVAALLNGQRSLYKRAIGDEFIVSNSGTDHVNSVASISDDIFVVAWHSYRFVDNIYSTDCYGQIFNKAGEKIGTEFRANTNTTDSQIYPSVAGLSNENFIIAWQSNGQDGEGSGIYGQLFNNTAGIVGTEFRVNTNTTGDQNFPSVAGLSNGNFVIAWSIDIDIYTDVRGQLFNSTAGMINAEFRVNTMSTTSQSSVSVAGLSNGNFVIAWDCRPGGIGGQLFSSTGGFVGSEFLVNTNTNSDYYKHIPSVAGLNNGNFVITWISQDQDGSYGGVYSQLFNDTAEMIGSEFCVNTYTTDDQNYPSVAGLSNGNFIITWSSGSYTYGNYDIYSQLFNSTGGFISPEFQVNTYSNDEQFHSFVAGLSNGDFVIVWNSYNQDSSKSNINGTIFNEVLIPSTSSMPSLVNTNTTSSKPSRKSDNLIIAVVSSVGGGLLMAGLIGFGFWRMKKTSSLKREVELSDINVISVPTRQNKNRTIIKSRYELVNKITQAEAEELTKQTGIEVTFLSNKKEKFVLGIGQFGKLRLAYDLSSNQFVGVKKIKNVQGSAINALESSKNEGDIQQKLSGCSHIMPLLDSVETTGSNNEPVLYQFMPLAGWGNGDSLTKRLKLSQNDEIKTKVLVHAAKSLLMGIQAMHQKHIYHLDMKPSNVVFNNKGYLFIIDFGCAYELTNGLLNGGYADTRYCSPERLANYRYNNVAITGHAKETVNIIDAAKVDAWTIGLTLLEWTLGVYPFDQHSYEKKLEFWNDAYFTSKLMAIPELNESAVDSLWAVIKALLEVDPSKRISVTDALAMPVFQIAKYQFEKNSDCELAFSCLRLNNEVQEKKKPKAENEHYVYSQASFFEQNDDDKITNLGYKPIEKITFFQDANSSKDINNNGIYVTNNDLNNQNANNNAYVNNNHQL